MLVVKRVSFNVNKMIKLLSNLKFLIDPLIKVFRMVYKEKHDYHLASGLQRSSIVSFFFRYVFLMSSPFSMFVTNRS